MLTRESVLAAAVELADEVGLDAWTMRKLGDKLGVEAMSIYHHVPNKAAILDGMVDALFAEIELPTAATEWTEAMRARCESLRDVMVRHRWGVGLMDSRTSPGPQSLAHHDWVIGRLRAGGFSVAGAGHAFALLDSYVYGFVLQETALPFDPTGQAPEALGEVAAAIMADLPRDRLPHFSELTEHVLRPGYSFSAEFDVGLDLILDGLRARRDTW